MSPLPCSRFPEEQFALGAFTHPDATVRQQAVALAVDGCRWAAELGARDLIVWPQVGTALPEGRLVGSIV